VKKANKVGSKDGFKKGKNLVNDLSSPNVANLCYKESCDKNKISDVLKGDKRNRQKLIFQDIDPMRAVFLEHFNNVVLKETQSIRVAWEIKEVLLNK
jgi:Na+-transporting NADH:ubiquinone oxidoreductase subunit NqrA